MSDPTTARLNKAVAGDREAVRSLIDELTPVIQARAARALLRRRVAAGKREVRQEVEDLTQSVFLALFANDARSLRQWDPTRGVPLEAFIGVVAEREIASIMRSRKRSPWADDPTFIDDLDRSTDLEACPEVQTGSRETLAALLALLKLRLSERGLQMFYWLHVEDRSVEEVCDLAEMSADAVYAWRSRLGRLVRVLAAEILSENAGSARNTVQKRA